MSLWHPHHVAVVHGKTAGARDFKVHGRLYFVPVGRQAIAAEELASYYRQKFNIEIEVLPPMPASTAAYRPSRQQYAAEDITADIKDAHPELARDPDAVLIGLTDEDIFQQWLRGSNFTYSYHAGYRYAIVSTHRMDPGFWGDPPSDTVRLASTKQMLTKYIGLMYFHLPLSFDPTSVMHQPLTPNGGPDDLYESDLHSEESANGLQGNGWPCLSFVYSYTTSRMVPVSPEPTDCNLTNPPSSPDQEVFRLELGVGRLVVHGMDLKIDSTPPIEYRRAYISDYHRQRSLGWGTDVSFNRGLTSDGPAVFTYIEIVREDASRDRLERVSPGRGFAPNVVFEGQDGADGAYGARMAWEKDHFKIQHRDGSWETYLPCSDFTCFLSGSQDANGNKLTIQRDQSRALLQVRSQDEQGITFQSDGQHRITEASASSSERIAYEYDASGCLIRVHRPNGQVLIFDYDTGQHITRISVIGGAGERPRTVLKNEWDTAGHLVRQTLPDGSEYIIRYLSFAGSRASRLTVQEPSGRILHFELADEDYREWTEPVKFPAAR